MLPHSETAFAHISHRSSIPLHTFRIPKIGKSGNQIPLFAYAHKPLEIFLVVTPMCAVLRTASTKTTGVYRILAYGRSFAGKCPAVYAYFTFVTHLSVLLAGVVQALAYLYIGDKRQAKPCYVQKAASKAESSAVDPADCSKNKNDNHKSDYPTQNVTFSHTNPSSGGK